MKKVLFICFMLAVHYAHCQTTNFSFSSLSFSSTDLINPNRGAEHWLQANAAFNGVDHVKLPGTTDVRAFNYYKRINWALIENAGSGTTPGNPRYTWTNFDNEIKSAIDNGQMFSFGILPVAPDYDPYGASGAQNLSYPTWLHNLQQTEGTKDWLYNGSNDWIPDWNSSSFLNALDSLNYNVNAHINATSYTPSTGPWAGISVPFSKVIFCIDIRGYGQSGEWNMSGFSGSVDPQISAGRHPTTATFKRMIDSHKNAYANFQLVAMSDGFSTDAGASAVIPAEVVNYFFTQQNNKGYFGWRRDNWGADWYDYENLAYNTATYSGWHADTAIQNRWKLAPITGEPYNGSITATGINPGGGTSPYYDMPREVRLYHSTSFGNNNYYLDVSTSTPMRDSIRLASKTAGYRLESIAGYMTTTLTQNQNFTVSNTWRNSGVAPVYLPTKVKYELRTSADALLATFTSAFSPTKFLPGDSTVTETFNLGSVATGTTHKLNVIFVDSSGYAIPIKLALTSPAQNGDGSYTLRSNITVQAAGVLPGKIRLRKL